MMRFSLPGWLLPPTYSDEETTRVAGLLNILIWTIEFILVFDAVVLYILAPETLPTFWINGLAFALALTIRQVMLRGQVRTACYLLCFFIWFMLTYYLAISNGLRSPTLSFLGLVVIMSAILLGRRGAVIFGTLCSLTLIGLYLAGNSGTLVSVEGVPTLGRLLATNIASICALSVFAAIGGHSVYDALVRSRNSERTLTERNHELQKEIVERKKLEEERTRLVSIVETTVDFVGMVDRDGKVIYLNHGARCLVGLSDADDVTATVLTDYHPPDMAKLLIDQGLPAARRDGNWAGENVVLTRDGREIPVSQIVLAHRDATGAIDFYSTLMRDLSERKQAEQQHLQLTLERERLLNFKDFLNTISHDLKTPLSVLNISLYLLEKSDDPARQKRNIDTIRQNTKFLEKYILDILTIARLEQIPDLMFQSINLQSLLEQVVNLLQPAAHDKHIVLTLEAIRDLPLIKADSEELSRGFTNLAENAIHYTPNGGSVIIRVTREAQEAVVSIVDTGIGIEAEALSHIFERFYRTQAGHNFRSKGTGLGLGIAKKIIEMHHGQIEVQSVLGAGSTFRIRLPIPQLLIG